MTTGQPDTTSGHIPGALPRTARPVWIDRFWEKVQKTDRCWVWTGSTDQDGYGTIKIGSHVPARVHRLSYELHVGPISDGMHVLHACDNPPCVNPSHLSVGTRDRNMQECVKRGRHSNGNQQKTHCPQGHPYNAANTYIASNGSRKCRTCRREASRSYAARRSTRP